MGSEDIRDLSPVESAETIDADGTGPGTSPDDDWPDFGPRYEVLSLLGAGGMGRVYRARDRELDEIVALKTLIVDHGDPRALVRFRREVKLARRVTHPNVARIYDLNSEHSSLFLTMEFIDGPSLRSLLSSRTRLPWTETASIGRSICEGLSAAHSVDVIHRDLKPENVMLGSDDRVVLADFGIATTRHQDEQGKMVGTPHYMAPEQARGGTVDERADLYALGCMLWEMLSGRLLWNGASIMAIIARRLVDPPAELPDDVEAPPLLRDLIRQCLARDPADRPWGAHLVSRALGNITAEHGEAGTLVFESMVTSTNLTSRANSFVGRRAERDELAVRLDEGQRLVTLLGPGGSGKTRLVQEFGLDKVSDYKGGVWFCDLAEARTLEDIHEVVASVLEIPSPTTEATVRLGRALAARGPSLVILDNLEQIIEAAAGAITSWIELAPFVTFVVTSRVRLGLESEHLMRVEPLDVASGISLFEQRARQVRPRFDLDDTEREIAAEIVERLDGLPLAIEIAAAQMRMIDLPRLLDRIDDRFRTLRSGRRDRPERHLTMRGVLDSSWELLSPSARLVLAQLSVFRAGATLDAACQVIDLVEIEDAPWPEEAFEELWDHSLIRWTRKGNVERLMLLETVREYAAERLDDKTKFYERHAAVFAEFGTQNAIEEYHSHGGDGRIVRLLDERENIQAACQRAIELGRPREAVRTLAALDEMSARRGQPPLEFGEAILSMPELDGADRIVAMRIAASLYRRVGRLEDAMVLIQRAKSLVESGREYEIARLEFERAVLLWTSGRFEDADRLASELYETFGTLGDPRHRALIAQRRGLTLWNLGQLEDASYWLERAIELLQDVGDQRSLGTAFMNMGLIEVDRGQIDTGIELYQKALTLIDEKADQLTAGLVLTNLATALSAGGNHDAAQARWEHALEIHTRTGDRRATGLVLLNQGQVDITSGEIERAKERLGRALAIFRETGERRFEGISLGTLAMALAESGDPDEVQRKFDCAETILRDTGDRHGLGRMLCKRGLFDVSRGETDKAKLALKEASKIREELGAGPRSTLSQIIQELEDAL